METSGKYDFTMTCEVIEMMEAESKDIVNWSYDYQIAKGSSDKYNLKTRIMTKYYIKDYVHQLGQL